MPARRSPRPALAVSVMGISVFCAPSPALAQSRAPNSSVTTGEADKPAAGQPPLIIVTGRGLADGPASPAYDTVTIPREIIDSSASGRIEDVLSNVAGFQQYRRSDSRATNPSNQGVTLRALGGNASSRTLVLLDGVPVANPFFGYVPLSALTPGSIGAVRVTRGGGTGAFGAGAVAGTIQLDSAGPDRWACCRLKAWSTSAARRR